jgi:hypothetical protein
MLPNGTEYNKPDKLEVSSSSNRIVEKIINYYAEKRSRLPMKILSAIAILGVYWETKDGLGHNADLKALNP